MYPYTEPKRFGIALKSIRISSNMFHGRNNRKPQQNRTVMGSFRAENIRSRFPSPESLKQLADVLVQEWDNIRLENIHTLYEPISRRISAILQEHGGPKPY